MSVRTATFYTPGVGSCGRNNVESDFIVAVDHATITSFPGAGANPNLYVSSPSTTQTPDTAYLPPRFFLNHTALTSPCNSNPMCGRKMRVTHGKQSVVVTVVDTCPGCAVGSVDLTPAAFKKLAPLSVGRIHGVKWTLL